VPPLHEIIDKDDDDENWADLRAPSGGTSRPGNGNDNNNCQGEENTQGGKKGTGKWNGGKAGKRNGKGKGKGTGNGKGKRIVNLTPGGDDICLAVALQLQKETYEADSDTED
jgi:hypothetical protein